MSHVMCALTTLADAILYASVGVLILERKTSKLLSKETKLKMWLKKTINDFKYEKKRLT